MRYESAPFKYVGKGECGSHCKIHSFDIDNTNANSNQIDVNGEERGVESIVNCADFNQALVAPRQFENGLGMVYNSILTKDNETELKNLKTVKLTAKPFVSTMV